MLGELTRQKHTFRIKINRVTDTTGGIPRLHVPFIVTAENPQLSILEFSLQCFLAIKCHLNIFYNK